MKKSLFLFATAALVLASCSNDVTISENTVPAGSNAQQEIAFSPLSNTPKYAIRRAAVDGATFPAVTMQVSAYDATNAKNFFSAVTFTKDGGSGTWKAGKYWPLAPATINFLAYAEFNAGTATWDATNPASAVTLEMDDNSTAQKDLMYACGTGTVTQSSNTLTFPANVPMTFKHAQAWIKFTVKAKTSTEATAITVNSITLNSVSCQGTYTVTHANWNKTKAQRDAADPAGALDGSVSGAWSAYTPAGNIAAVKAAGYSALSTDAQDYASLMVVPDQGMASFTINYTVDGNTYDYTYTPASTTLAQATKYVYNITFQLHEILIAPEITDWANGGTTNITVDD